MKVNITLADDLMNRVDNYASANYMSRSGLISFAVTQFLNQSDVIMCIKDMSLAMRKISDTGIVDKETIKQLEDFQRFAEVFTVKK